MTIALKPNGDGSAEIQVNGVTRIAISAAGVVTMPNTPNTQLGVGQAWQDVTASRAFNTTYTNSTDKPIVVNAGSTSSTNIVFLVNGVLANVSGPFNTGNTIIVPPGSTYRLNSSATLFFWSELR